MIARRIAGCAALCLIASVRAWSQTSAHQEGMAGMDHAAMGPVSAQAQRQIAVNAWQLRQLVRPGDSTDR
jgi:hypothetical protein